MRHTDAVPFFITIDIDLLQFNNCTFRNTIMLKVLNNFSMKVKDDDILLIAERALIAESSK